jgi:hypothetical protein
VRRSASTAATTHDHKEVTMKTQISKQHTNEVAVQPLTTFRKADRMKNAHRIHFESQGAASQTATSRGLSGHRLGTMFAVAMSILLLGLICSAQTTTYIPQYTSPTTTIDSIMNQPIGANQINVNNGSFNLTSFANTYKIGSKEVLKATDFPGSGSMRSLSLGIGAGSISSTLSGTGSNTFVGAGAGSLNTNSAANTFIGDEAGYKNTTGGWNICMGSGACFSNSVSTGNTMLGTYSGFNTTGGSNTFVGIGAGGNTTTGSSNIYIGPNAQGAPTENNTIRIGVQGTGGGQQSSAYMAGIVSNPTTYAASSVPVVTIGTDGHLGIQNIATGGITGSCSSGKITMWTGTSSVGCSLLSQSGSTVTMSGSITATSNVQVNGNLNANGYVKATTGFQTSGGTGISATINLTDVNGNPCFIVFQGGIATTTSCP